MLELKEAIKIPPKEFQILVFYYYLNKNCYKTKKLLEIPEKELTTIIKKHHHNMRLKLELCCLHRKAVKALFDYWPGA